MKRQIVAGVLAFGGLIYAAPVGAHISLEQGGTHLSRYGDGSIKAGPCGVSGGKRGTNVYTYAPGQTISVSIVEFVPHPSYFRIAFDANGDGAFKEPASILPIDPKRKCPDGPGDHCGASDFYNAPSVLPGLDNLDPHLAAASKSKYTWSVTLPNVECTSCTLQIIQVMQDDQFHGPYDPTPGVGIEDIYHQCIDLVLARGAVSSGPDASAGGTSGTSGQPADPGSSSSSSGKAGGGVPPGPAGTSSGGGGGGGCNVATGGAGVSSLGLLLAGLAFARRRRPR